MFFRRHIYTTIFFISFSIILFNLFSCTDKQEKISAIKDRSKARQVRTTDITTVISDSGITRYRVTTPLWDIYDKATEPYWEFPKGIHLEEFDNKMKTTSNIHADYAHFNQAKQLWELRGKVRMSNLNGQLIETEQVFWDQRKSIFYNNCPVKITNTTEIMKVVGFESDQSMIHIKPKKITGIFSLKN